MLLDPKSEVRREIALDVIGQLPPDLIAIDFYETRFARHEPTDPWDAATVRKRHSQSS